MSLAQEIAGALPALMADHPKGPTAKDVAAFIAAPYPNVLRAFDAIKAEGLAVVVRYPGARARHVVPLGYNFGSVRLRACAHCDGLFKRPNRDTRFCCASCFAQDMWSKPERREKGSAASKRAAQLPSRKAVTAKMVALQKSPEGRERQRERNWQMWADPVKRAKISAGIQAKHGTPEKRKHFSEVRKRQWTEPEFREKTISRMLEANATPEVKAKRSAGAKKRAANPEDRERRRAVALANAEHIAQRFKGKKQSPEQIAKRIAARRAKAAERGSW